MALSLSAGILASFARGSGLKDLAIWAVFPTFPVNAPPSPNPAPPSPSPPVHKTAKIEPCDPASPPPLQKSAVLCTPPPDPPPRRHPHHQKPPTTTQAPQSNKNPGRAMLDPGHTRKSRRNYLVPRRISAFTSARASSKVGPSLSPRCQKSQPSLSIPKLCAAKSGSSKTRPSTVMRPSVPKVP